MMVVLSIIYGVLVIVELALIISFHFKFKKPSTLAISDDNASILVCARNEEDNLERCLDSLLASALDLKRVEILVGDDNSTDKTWEIIQNYEKVHPSIRGIKIQDEKDGLIAKGNVLAQLVDAAHYDKILIIDADMKVSHTWMKTMRGLLNDHDMVSGLTMIDKDFYRPSIQFFDWAVVLHSMKAMADAWQAISILGNNMGFNRKAYDKVGGFKDLGPTDVEDLGLQRRFQKAGLKTFQYLGAEGQAFTKAQNGWKEMLIQRCRWMNGVFTHHWLLGIPALFARLWVMVSLVSMYFDIQTGFLILCYGLFVNWIKYTQVVMKTKNSYIFAMYLPAVISLLDTFALIRVILFGKVSWKGRKF